MASSPQPWLLKAPVEVIVHIASYLSTSEYCALRLACKHTESALFHSFANEFFKRRLFMLTEFSLQALVDITKSRLAPSVEYVSICLDKPRCTQSQLVIHRNRQVDEYKQALHQNRFLEEHENHKEFTSTGGDYQLLVEGLKGLPNLQALSVRDFHSSGRFREGNEARWRPYGSATFFKETSVATGLPGPRGMFGPPSPMINSLDDPELLYLKHVFTTVLRAWGAVAEDCSASRFEVILRKLVLNDHTFSISNTWQAAIRPALHHLKALYLDISASSAPTKVEGQDQTIKPSYNYHLIQFLSHTPNIEHLRINCKENQVLHTENELFSWLAERPENRPASSVPRKYPGLPQIRDTVEFPQLQIIQIGFAKLNKDTLLKLFMKLRSSLQSITLHKISLVGTQAQMDDKVNLWSRLLNQISSLDLALKSISLEEVGQCVLRDNTGLYISAPVRFNGSEHPGLKKTWSGQATKHGLKDFISALEVQWPPAPLNRRTSSEEDNSDEDDDGDDGDDGDDSSDDDEDDGMDADVDD